MRKRGPFAKLDVEAETFARIEIAAVVSADEGGDRPMSVAELDELTAVLGRVRTWSQAGRIALLKGVVETLAPEASSPPTAHVPAPPPAPRGRSVEEIRETFKTDKPAPEVGPKADGPKRGQPVEKALGLLKTDREPPDDEECRRIVEEERWTKYGS